MKYKNFLILGFVFLIGLISGGFFRFWIFAKWQVYLFEKNVIEKDIAQTKLGGRTPEETWNLFVSELTKGNIDNAVQYIILNKQTYFKNYLERLKEENKLEELIKKIKNRNIIQLPKKVGIEEDEALYTYLNEEEIKKKGKEITTREDYKKMLEIDKKWGIPEEYTFKEYLLSTLPTITFKYNRYTGKWIIKDLFFDIY